MTFNDSQLVGANCSALLDGHQQRRSHQSNSHQKRFEARNEGPEGANCKLLLHQQIRHPPIAGRRT